MTVETGPVSSRLLELQDMDQQIRAIQDRAESFQGQLEAVEEPAQQLAEEVAATEIRVRDLRLEERRLRLAAEEKRLRVHRLEERLNLVRTVREEAAVQAELGLVRRALDQEEQEVISLLDQIGRLEDRLDEQRAGMDEARSAVAPKKEEIRAQQEAIRSEAASLEVRRGLFAEGIERRYLAVYEELAKGGRKVAVAPMTDDGACGSCFSLIPLQLQNEIRSSGRLVSCEACGVIVTAPSDVATDGLTESASQT